MKDITSNIIRALDDDPYFDGFEDCNGDLKIWKDSTSLTGEIPFISVEIVDRKCNVCTEIENASIVIRIHGEECMRSDMYDMACQIKEILCNLRCLPQCNDNGYTFNLIGSVESEWGYNPVTCYNVLNMFFRASFCRKSTPVV